MKKIRSILAICIIAIIAIIGMNTTSLAGNWSQGVDWDSYYRSGSPIVIDYYKHYTDNYIYCLQMDTDYTGGQVYKIMTKISIEGDKATEYNKNMQPIRTVTSDDNILMAYAVNNATNISNTYSLDSIVAKNMQKTQKTMWRKAQDWLGKFNPAYRNWSSNCYIHNGGGYGLTAYDSQIFTMEEAKALLNEDKEEYSIPLKITKANKTVADIGSKAFPDRLGTCTTRYDAGNINRSTNLGIATRKINEYVLQPGEVFSYNRALGPRTVQNGYKEAHVFSGGEVVDGLGGGICQISSTLYNAVLEANLEIVERRNHSFTSGYLPAGKDATVVYGAIDFRFRNSRKYPIKITASISGGVATVSIWGLKEEVEYDVKIVSTILQNYPCAEEVIYDPNLRDGMRQIVKAGTDGCKSVTYKYVYSKSGQLISKTHLSTDTYGTIKRVVRVGTGGIPQEPTPTPSTTPEPSPSMDPTPSVSPSPEPSVEPSPTPSTSPAPEPSTTPDPSPSPEPSEEPDGE